MSNPFGSPTPNLFSPGTSASPYAPTLGLRQRPQHVANQRVATGGDQNANPNRNANTARGNASMHGFGKWGSMSNVPAPPRANLLSSPPGKPFQARGVSATAPQQQTRDNTSTTAEASQQAIVPTNEREEEDLSLWVIGYGEENDYCV